METSSIQSTFPNFLETRRWWIRKFETFRWTNWAWVGFPNMFLPPVFFAAFFFFLKAVLLPWFLLLEPLSSQMLDVKLLCWTLVKPGVALSREWGNETIHGYDGDEASLIPYYWPASNCHLGRLSDAFVKFRFRFHPPVSTQCISLESGFESTFPGTQCATASRTLWSLTIQMCKCLLKILGPFPGSEDW